MNRLATLLLVLLVCVPAWAEPPSPKPTTPMLPGLGSVTAYKQPFPHSSGAELLPFCELTGEMVSQVRCDYYVQAIADMVTIELKGKRLACIPQGQSRTQLMELAVRSLKKTHPNMLEQQSAASLIMQSFARAFPCPVVTKAGSDSPQMGAALRKRLDVGKKKAAQISASQRMADTLSKRLAAGEIKVGEGGLTAEKAEAFKKQLAAHKQKKEAKTSLDCKCPDASKATETAATPASSDALQATATPTAVTSPEASQTTVVPQTPEIPQTLEAQQ
jgi:hypothetical protein